jgi:predicted transcriptional regulator
MTQIPCIVVLPSDREKRITMLESVFGSKVKVEILKSFCAETGVRERVFQQDLIEALPYSNKTIITHITELTKLGILDEGMEKRKGWQKYLSVKKNMEWIVFLLQNPEGMSDARFKEGVRELTFEYLKRVRELIKEGKLTKEEVRTTLGI